MKAALIEAVPVRRPSQCAIKRLRDKDVLTPEEFQNLVQQLSVRDRAMVLLIGSTGLRRSEMIALTWSDLNLRTMEVNVLRSCVRNRIGKTKTESSCRPVPLHPLVLNALLGWRAKSPYSTDVDFLFPSVRFKGSKPLSPDSILDKSIRPALVWIGVAGKHIGWHSFRHSLATNLRSLGVDIKVAQELMRHSSCRTTLDIYTRAVDQQKRDASLKVVELMLPLNLKKFQHPSAPSKESQEKWRCRKPMSRKGLLVDLIGNRRPIEGDSATHQELRDAERQNSSRSVTVCRRSSARDFLCDADFAVSTDCVLRHSSANAVETGRRPRFHHQYWS
jgi:hypothetical protein